MGRKQQYIYFPNGLKMRYSARMKCEPENVVEHLNISIGSDAWGIPYATSNMQKDYADFEGIAFAVWSILPECNITLQFDSMEWNLTDGDFPIDYDKVDERVLDAVNAYNKHIYESGLEKDKKDGKFRNRKIMKQEKLESHTQHYLRFLYRVSKVRELYGKHFFVATKNEQEVNLFSKLYDKALRENKLMMTEPERDSGAKGGDTISENHLEKWFVLHAGKDEFLKTITEWKNKCDNIELYDQFPCGMFYEKKSEANRLFNGGAFDLWGVNSEGNICLFELKEARNHSLGIISELFFYSCLIKDFKVIVEKSSMQKKFRGFDNFCAAKGDIKAYFLVPKLYPFMKENISAILEKMNERDDGVSYDCIEFDQEKIVKPNVKTFIENLKEDWKVKTGKGHS